MSEIKAGSYTAKIVAYGTKKTLTGEGAIVIQFAFEADGNNHSLSWQGSTKNTTAGKKTPLQITLETLETCGFDYTAENIVKNISALANGTSSGMLDTDKEVSIKVEHEMGNDGSMYPRIKWVNKIGGGAFKNMMSSGESAQVFAGITGDLMAFAATRRGEKKPVAMFDGEAIPF